MLTTTPIELKRHYHRLTPDETEEVARAVADLIVTHVKRASGDVRLVGRRPPCTKRDKNARRAP